MSDEPTVVCPACGGPALLALRGAEVRWHKPWHVGSGGRLHQRGADGWCLGRPDPTAGPEAELAPARPMRAEVAVVAAYAATSGAVPDRSKPTLALLERLTRSREQVVQLPDPAAVHELVEVPA